MYVRVHHCLSQTHSLSLTLSLPALSLHLAYLLLHARVFLSNSHMDSGGRKGSHNASSSGPASVIAEGRAPWIQKRLQAILQSWSCCWAQKDLQLFQVQPETINPAATFGAHRWAAYTKVWSLRSTVSDHSAAIRRAATERSTSGCKNGHRPSRAGGRVSLGPAAPSSSGGPSPRLRGAAVASALFPAAASNGRENRSASRRSSRLRRRMMWSERRSL